MDNKMEVIANNMTAILDLAHWQIRTEHHLRRLQTFINLQFFACIWGIVPGTLGDENTRQPSDQPRLTEANAKAQVRIVDLV
jgi:hypothetical protein